MNDSFREFLSGDTFAVVGASANRDKYGNKVLRVYQQNHKTVYPVNPRESTIEGLPTHAKLADIPERVHGLSIITPPEVTGTIIAEAIALGIHHVWMQPGAESQLAIRQAEEAGMNVIAGGPCILVALRFREDA